MQLNRPPTAPEFLNERKMDIGKEPVTLKAGSLMGLGSKHQYGDHNYLSKVEIPSCIVGSL